MTRTEFATPCVTRESRAQSRPAPSVNSSISLSPISETSLQLIPTSAIRSTVAHEPQKPVRTLNNIPLHPQSFSKPNLRANYCYQPMRSQRYRDWESDSEESDCEPEVKYLDWDEDEFQAVRAHGLHYTIRSSKYPRTLENPERVILILNDTHHWSVHRILLTKFSTKIAALFKSNPNLGHIRINGIEPVGSLPAWEIFLTWLYTFDKVPLTDFTPIRHVGWRTRHMKDACFLSAFLGAAKFEKYLLRIIFKEVHDGRFSEKHLRHLKERMPPSTGMYHFSTAYFRWKSAGKPGELDPYRWRVEHWYFICGRVSNWGCFHAMNTSGWGGVWERQEDLREKVEWMDEILYDEVEMPDPWGESGGCGVGGLDGMVGEGWEDVGFDGDEDGDGD